MLAVSPSATPALPILVARRCFPISICTSKAGSVLVSSAARVAAGRHCSRSFSVSMTCKRAASRWGGRTSWSCANHTPRTAIGSVPQDISLFHRWILENVRYGRPDASDTEVLRAIEAARCSNFINALPEGVATIVGNRGVKLSPGQRQRIAIARAFLKDAPILLLDEATSALDTESEEAIRDALDRLMRG